MEGVFLVKLALSFSVGALWAVFAVFLAEKYGTRIGGLVTGLPSTIIFGLFFIAWTQNPKVAVEATTIVPIVGGINCLFLATYIYFAKNGLRVSLLSSLLLWSLLSLSLVLTGFNNYPISLISYMILLPVSYYLVQYKFNVKSVQGIRIVYTPNIILFRGILSGSVVALAVLAAKLGGPSIGGMFSMFPAMFTSTILIIHFSHGPSFSSATMKSAMLSAISVIVYSIVARYTYQNIGIVRGTLVSLTISFATGYLIYRYLIKRFS